MKRLTTIGDTIIEAMIAVSIIGITIAGAYGIATRSLKLARQAQERGEALKLAEGQLETIRGIFSDNNAGNDVPLLGAPIFCHKGNTRHVIGDFSGAIPALDADNLDLYDQCTEGLYHLAVETTDLGGGRYQFTAVVRWFSLGDSEKEELRIDYRMYRGT